MRSTAVGIDKTSTLRLRASTSLQVSPPLHNDLYREECSTDWNVPYDSDPLLLLLLLLLLQLLLPSSESLIQIFIYVTSR